MRSGLKILAVIYMGNAMIITKIEVKVNKILPEAKLIYTCRYTYMFRGEIKIC
jgi:hypothetical protein